MGFLDHSTNNIILDAVLTDTGRELLSRNDGSFSIEKFALGDDEVNYGIIRKYGRTVGKEKIEKNTPVFEALTDQSQSQKYRLVSNSNPNLVKMPGFTVTGDATFSGGIFTIWQGGTPGKPTQANVSVVQSIINDVSISVEFRDEQYVVDVPHLFLRLNGNIPPNSIDKMQRAQYIGGNTGGPYANGGTGLQFIIASKNINSQTFDVYGSGQNKDTIRTYVRVTGFNSGAVVDIPVYIKRPTTT